MVQSYDTGFSGLCLGTLQIMPGREKNPRQSVRLWRDGGITWGKGNTNAGRPLGGKVLFLYGF